MPTIASPPLGIVAYLALFMTVGILFLLVNLLVGHFIRPRKPSDVKGQIYECGEPSIGSGFVQFDLRFYVVALVFIIFDVEVAFFFPWATVFGKATQLAAAHPANQVVQAAGDDIALTQNAANLYREMGVVHPQPPREIPPSLTRKLGVADDPAAQSAAIIQSGARQFALITLVDIGIFFAVLVVGFAYVWFRRDLDWVRSLVAEGSPPAPPPTTASGEVDLEKVLSV